jgi:hypothetical protein
MALNCLELLGFLQPIWECAAVVKGLIGRK